MEIKLLGALRVIDEDGHEVEVSSARQRALLASLALRIDRVVPVDTLVEYVWDGAPPPSAPSTLYSHVMRLRRTLGGALAGAVVTETAGYLLRGDEVQVDVHRVRALREQAARVDSEGDTAGAARLLEEAMALCRGPLLADVECAALRREHGPGVDELRTGIAEDRAEARLRLGEHPVAIDELRTLVAEQPLRERSRTLLLIALAGSGRRAEALEEYQQAKRALATGPGVEPGPQLRQAHQRVLHNEVPLERPRRPAAPDELPPDISGFVGRAAELDTLDSLLARDEPAVAVVEGIAGVGKTSLVLHWAHRNRQHFPDGQLFLNLRGSHPRQPPLPPGAVLTSLLESLGVPPGELPEGKRARSSTLLGILTGRRLLLVLDNARDANQIPALLPDLPGCLVLVTSRRSLASLSTGEGARRIPLAPLNASDARSLLRHWSISDETVLEEVPECCGRLPLTLRIVASRIAASPAERVPELIGELYASTDPLRELTGNAHTTVRDVLSWSYRTLSSEAARTLRLLDVHFGHDFGAPIAEALLNTSDVTRSLDELASVHLIDRESPEHYAFHDLTRWHAGEWSADEPDSERRSAETRLLDWYLHTAVAASGRIQPNRLGITLPGPGDSAARAQFPDHDSAVDWFAREQHNLLATIEAARQHGRHEYAWKLGWSLWSYFYLRDERDRLGPIADVALDSARALADAGASASASAEGIMLAIKGTGLLRSGHAEDATECYQRALALHRLAGDRAHEARTMNSLGATLAGSGALIEAAELLERAYELSSEIGDDLATASSVHELGQCNTRLGNYELAQVNYRELALLARQLDDPRLEAAGYVGLGELHDAMHDNQRALRAWQHALTLFQQVRSQRSEAHMLRNIGTSLYRLGRRSEAVQTWRRALALYAQLGDPHANEVQASLESV